MEAATASTEMLAMYTAREEHALACQGDTRTVSIPLDVRRMAIQFLSKLALGVGSDWFNAATLFNASCGAAGVGMHLLPARCVAVARLILKMNEVSKLISQAQLAELFVLNLKEEGFEAPYEVTERAILEQEHLILEALDWQIALPSVKSWLSIIAVRFNVLTQDRYAKLLDWAWDHIMRIALILVALGPVGKSSSSSSGRHTRAQHLAVGAFGMGLMTARLLPSEALRSSICCPIEWEKLLAGSNLVPQTTCKLSECGIQNILDAFQLATMSDLPELQEYCLHTASLYRELACTDTGSSRPAMKT